jgi:hypothetical protein
MTLSVSSCPRKAQFDPNRLFDLTLPGARTGLPAIWHLGSEHVVVVAHDDSLKCVDDPATGQPDCLAQVWTDHICLRPLAASGFRLTLNEGAEPSLGAPGPE